MTNNPFILRGYVADEFFCDREQETVDLIGEVSNGNNVTLIAPRRVGKTGLILHTFNRPEMKARYYTFLIDLYATKNIEEMVQELGKSILNALKPHGTKVIQAFVNCLRSLRSSVSFDSNGTPSWSVEIGDIQTPDVTLDEIFRYLNSADRPCIVAIDEFQTVATYPEGNVEALLRTHVQHCHNAAFIFAGSKRNMMSEMFLSHSRPFYQSTSIKSLSPIPLEKYAAFACRLFGRRQLPSEVVQEVYERFDGITWYVQRMMNKLYALTTEGETVTPSRTADALRAILDESGFAYQSLLYQLPAKQKSLLIAISKAGKAQSVLSSAFIRKYRLSSTSSVQSALKGLLEKDFVTLEEGAYEVYDKFFALWLNRRNGSM